MRVTDLHLQNIRSYDNETVEFPDGTMLVHGENGAGKTTLLMGIFGGLFLSKIRNVGSNDFNLEEIVQRGTEEGEIKLTLEVGSTPYTVTWTLKTEGQNKATLDSPALSGPISGIRDVRSEVIDVIGMDEDSFSRSVYVQQGEVDRLFDDDARAELIDDLLGLDRIDKYVHRMKGARRAVGRLAEKNEQSAQNHQETIEEQFDYDVDGYESTLAEKETEITEKQGEVNEVESFLDDLEEAKRDVEESLEEHDELQADLEDAEEKYKKLLDDRTAEQVDIEEAETAVEEAESEIETLEDLIEEKRAALEELPVPATTDPIEIDVSTEAAADETLVAAQAAVETAQVEETNRDGFLDRATSERDRLIEERDDLREEKEELIADLDHLREEIETVEDKIETAEEELSEAITARNAETKSFLPADSCPESVSEETLEIVKTHTEELKNEKSELSEERAAKEASLDAAETTRREAQADVTEAQDDIERLETKLDEVRSDLETARKKQTEATGQFDEDLKELDANLDEFEMDVTDDTLQELIDDRIPNKKAELQDAIEAANAEVTKKEERKSTLEDDRNELQALDGVAICPKCGQDVDPEHLETELDEITAELSDLESELADATEDQETLVNRKNTLDEFREDAIELRQYRDDTVNTRADRVSSLKEDLEDLQSDLTDTKSELEDAEAEFEAADAEAEELRQRISELESRISTLETDIQSGADVTEAFESVSECRDERDELVEQLADLEDEEAGLEDDINEQDTDISEHTERIESQRETVKDAERALAAASDAVETATQQREHVSDIIDAYGEIDDLETTIASQQQDIGHARDTIENLNAQITEINDEIEETKDELGSIDVEEQRDTLETVTQKINEREESLDKLTGELEGLRQERTVLENDLEKLEYFHDQLALEESKREWAQDRTEELERMISVYRSTKTDLRERYLAYINEYTNDIFSDIYKNSSYQQVKVLEEGADGTPYAIQLLRDDGTFEHPSNASGGERAIVNLALRAGIYKLIAEMREGDTGRLPPFILDEPTTFLDKGHVGRLEQMLDSIAEWDVPQVIVVSHDERLIQGAEHEIEVSIDEDTNASRVDVYQGGRTSGDD